jgi:hypothetical protein
VLAYADTVYPEDLRVLLEGLGFDRVYREDIDRAVAAASGTLSSVGAVVGITPHPEPDRSRPKMSGLSRDAVFLLAILAGAYILFAAWPRIGQHRTPSAPSPPVAAAVATPQKKASRCLQSRRDDAVRWCQQALTGSPATQMRDEDSGGRCGNGLADRSATVRQALNGILDDGVQNTYTSGDAEKRCAEAAQRIITH